MFFTQILLFIIIFITFIQRERTQSIDPLENELGDEKRYSSSNYHGFDQVKNAMNFNKKVALVTGSNSGIGAETVRLFSYLGAQVVVTGRNATRISEVANECFNLSPNRFKPLEVTADLTVGGNVERLVYETIRAFGKIDILVNNAAVYKIANLTDLNFTKGYQEMTITNEVVPVYVTRLAVPYLKQTNGTVIFISSVSGVTPLVYEPAYTMSKGALLLLTKVLSLELGPNIRVNAISPALILNTRVYRDEPGLEQQQLNAILPVTPLQRVGYPLDVAKAVAFLASPLAEWIDGINLFLTGGA